MDDSTVAEITGWSAESLSDGYDDLHRLADRSFTGAVESGGTYLFVLNGAPVGVAEGTIEEFADAGATAYEAPDPSLPLLFAMQARGGDTRGRYYTEDTPVAEVDETLGDGGFTGYLELSENVLSGDYYAVYHGGKSLKVAFVGQSRRVLTGEEAWAKTRDEVGIFEVTAVPLDVLDVPGEPPADSGGGVADDGTDADVATAGDVDADEADDEPGEPTEADSPGESAPDREPAAEASDGIGVQPGDPADIEAAGSPASDEAAEPDQDAIDGEVDEDEASATGTSSGSENDDVTAVPSVDPDRSADGEGDRPGEAEASPADPGGATADLVDEVEAELAEREEELAEARRRVEELRDRRDDLQRQLDEVRADRDELRAELDRLGGGAGPPERSMAPAEVLGATTLFVRYDSKGRTTLSDMLSGEGEESALRSNLRVEHHTEFDDDGVVVDGQPLEAFLQGTQPYRFLEWLVTDLLLEIRATGRTDRLSKLHEALPAIDRVELDRAVAVTDPSDGSEYEVAFDFVARDKMGQPLVVADLEDSRDPVGESALAEFVEAAGDVCRTDDTLSAAFGVATSYFDSDALATAREATSGSLLSRDKRASFVKLSRKRGYHLGLVEDREHTFDLSVPDL